MAPPATILDLLVGQQRREILFIMFGLDMGNRQGRDWLQTQLERLRQVHDPACCTSVRGRCGPWRLDLNRGLVAFGVQGSDFSRPLPPGNELSFKPVFLELEIVHLGEPEQLPPKEASEGAEFDLSKVRLFKSRGRWLLLSRWNLMLRPCSNTS